MNKEQALHSFWNSFGIPFYDENSVPDDAVMPYGTYQVITSSFDDRLTLFGSLWYRSNSWEAISNKKDEIAAMIGHRLTIAIDDGYLVIHRGNGFAQRMGDEDDKVRRILITIDVEFLTEF